MSGSSFLSVYNLANLTAPASGVTHGAKFGIGLIGGQTANLNMLSQQEFLGPFLGQAMQVDNTANATDLVITELTYGWTRTVVAGGLQTFQYPAVQNQYFTFTSSGNIQAIVSIFDWPAFPDDAGSVGAASAVTIVGTVQVSGTVDIADQPIIVSPVPLQTTPMAPLSSIINVGGTAENVFPPFTNTGAYIVNPLSATESLFVDEFHNADTISPGANGTTVELVPGQSQSFQPSLYPVSANAITTGHTFVAVWRG